MPPTRIAMLSESGKIVRQADGTLTLIFLREQPENRYHILCRRTSRDHGTTWSDPEVLIELPEDKGYWGGLEALAGSDGEVHVWFMHDRGTGVFGPAMLGEGDKAKMNLQGQILDIWHLKSEARQSRWPMPKRIWEGYTGSFNSIIQMKSGRIVLPFSWLTNQTWLNRGEGMDTFTFHGNFTSTVVYSDDQGATWQQGTRDIKVWAFEAAYAYGSCEPVVIELQDGRVWMLIRTQNGRFYQSFSKDGASWSVASPTPLISSDSPAGLVRLNDGRLVLIWNACLRYPYAYGGRQVIHAAISEDDGKTWIGGRECMRDPKRLEPPPSGGDYGTAYPYPSVTADNRVIMISGQGKGRVQLVRIDPEWLYEKRAVCNFDDADEVQTFGTRGAAIVAHPERANAKALRLVKENDGFGPGRSSTAVWNFPMSLRGGVRLRARFEPGCGAFRVSLTDHFSTPYDVEDEYHAMFNITLGGGEANGALKLDDGRWHEIDLSWECASDRHARVSVDGKPAGTLPLLHHTTGINYVRLVAAAEGHDAKGAWFERVEAWAG